jgi:hypothetical protein
LTFATPATNPVCGTPTGLAVTSITATGATASWSAVAGATSYALDYHIAGTTTWSTTTTTTTSATFTTLTAATNYEVRVHAVCAAMSANSAVVSFTTSAAVVCTNNFEPNNTSATATPLAVNTDVNSMIATSTDVDYFSFSNTAAAKNIRITLSNLPFDYDLKLYNSAMTQVGSSANASTTTEKIILNNAAVGKYYVHVFPYGGALSSTKCYTVNASIGSTTFVRLGVGEAAEYTQLEDVQIYPNPATSHLTIKLNDFSSDAKVSIQMFDLMGKEILATEREMGKENDKAEMDISKVPNGMYIVAVKRDGNVTAKKIMVLNN